MAISRCREVKYFPPDRNFGCVYVMHCSVFHRNLKIRCYVDKLQDSKTAPI